MTDTAVVCVLTLLGALAAEIPKPGATSPPQPPPELSAPQSSAPAASTWVIDASASEVGFSLATTFHKVRGRSQAITGRIELPDAKTLVGARVNVQVDAATINSGSDKRDRDIHNKFLEVSLFPTLRFQSNHLSGELPEPGSSVPFAVQVEGWFEAHGISQPMTAELVCHRDRDALDCKTSFELSYRSFAMKSANKFIASAADDIHAHAHLVARPLAPGTVPVPATAPAAVPVTGQPRDSATPGSHHAGDAGEVPGQR